MNIARQRKFERSLPPAVFVIFSLENPVRFFYEAMGGKLVAERVQRMLGDPVPEVAFGWPKLALAEKTHAR